MMLSLYDGTRVIPRGMSVLSTKRIVVLIKDKANLLFFSYGTHLRSQHPKSQASLDCSHFYLWSGYYSFKSNSCFYKDWINSQGWDTLRRRTRTYPRRTQALYARMRSPTRNHDKYQDTSRYELLPRCTSQKVTSCPRTTNKNKRSNKTRQKEHCC